MDQSSSSADLVEIRRSNVHGLGAFATRRIPKGTRIIEYVGERVSHEEADRRYEDKEENDSHTFLFIVDSRTVIDAGVDGNEARFFNHSCDPNCESVIESRHVYIEATRDIEPGAELTYDYQIQREDDDPENIDDVFACRCGVAGCRGTMLWPTERPVQRKPRKHKSKTARKNTQHVVAKGKSRKPAGRGKSSARSKTRARKRSGRKKRAGRRR